MMPPKATSKIGSTFNRVVTTCKLPEVRMDRLLSRESPQIAKRETVTENQGELLISGKKTPKYPEKVNAIAAFVLHIESQNPQATRKAGSSPKAAFVYA